MHLKIIYFSYIFPFPTVREKSYVFTRGTPFLEFSWIFCHSHPFIPLCKQVRCDFSVGSNKITLVFVTTTVRTQYHLDPLEPTFVS